MLKVKVQFYEGGYCTHPEFVAVKGGSFKSVKFPALAAMIIHPTLGPILFDTGYSEHFYKASKKIPYNIYAKVTPVFVNDQDKISFKVKQQKFDLADFKYIILSHFHADHIGAVKDFPYSSFIYVDSSYNWVKEEVGLSAVTKGFLPELLPADFTQRSKPLQEKDLLKEAHFLKTYFDKVYDLFSDGSIIGIELPGHFPGQLGLYFETDDQKFFLIADACFLSKTYQSLIFPNEIIRFLNHDTEAYKDTILRINRVFKNHPDIEIIPSHCNEKIVKYLHKSNEI